MDEEKITESWQSDNADTPVQPEDLLILEDKGDSFVNDPTNSPPISITDDKGMPEGLGGDGKNNHKGRIKSFFVTNKKDIFALFVILLAALLYLSPSLKDGYSFGPTDLGRTLSVLTNLPPSSKPLVHNVINGDIITQGVAWNTLDWKLVHSGHVPLWNDESGTGLPQLLNFESAPFALPSLIGYLFPLNISFLITVLMKLLIAGTGVYFFLRALRASPTASVFAGVSFMLSGPFTGWLGWSISGPLAFIGWISFAALLCYRRTERYKVFGVVLLGLSTAFCIYGGFPEDYVLLAITLIALFLFAGIAFVIRYKKIDFGGIFRIGLGLISGFLLSSPLLLPGISVLRSSVRNVQGADIGLPLKNIALFFAQGYDGLPTTTSTLVHSSYFGSLDYFETASYIGVLAIVFALFAVLALYKRPILIGLAASGAVTFLVIFELGASAPVQHLISDMGLGGVALQRALSLLDFVIAALAGLGLDFFLKNSSLRKIQLKLFASLGAVGLVLVFLWDKATVGTAIVTGTPFSITSVQASAIRQASLLWPTFMLVILLLIDMWLFIGHKDTKVNTKRRIAVSASLLLIIQGGFLIFAGVGINSYSATAYPETAAVEQLQHLVGNSLVGLDGDNENCGTHPVPPCGLRQWEGIGLYPNMNLGYSLSELAMHDPTIPKSYFDAFPVANNDQNGGGTNIFAPAIDSAALARLYGVSYVIIQSPNPIPRGMKYVGSLENNNAVLKVAKVTDSGRFEFVYHTGRDQLVSTRTEKNHSSRRASRRYLSYGKKSVFYSGSHPGDAVYDLSVRAKQSGILYAKITDIAGWHASVNGESVVIKKSAGDLMQISLPKGRDNVVFTYDPALLNIGYYLAILCIILLAGGYLLEQRDYLSRRKTTKA